MPASTTARRRRVRSPKCIRSGSSRVHRDLLQRAERIRTAEIEFIPNPEFSDPIAAGRILRDPLPPAPARQAVVPPTASGRGSNPYVSALYETQLLSPAQEVFLFRKFNYVKYRAAELRDGLDLLDPDPRTVAEIEALLAEANRVRNHILSANLRLVVSVAKKYVDTENAFADLVSDGNISLLRAVEKFDYGRGFRFSTYATWALRKNYGRAISKRRLEMVRFRPADEEILSLAADTREAETNPEQRLVRLRAAVGRVIAQLAPRERQVVAARFGLDGAGQPQTLAAVGVLLGISKERVRQLEARALKKLRTLADEARLAPADSF